MAKYEVGISRNVWTVITIEADSIEQAWEIAHERADVHDWDEYNDGDTQVDYVEEIKHGN
jgi:hypothetical protein